MTTGFSPFKDQYECQTFLGGIICVAKLDLSPKALSYTTWPTTHSKMLVNVIIDYEYH